MEIRWLEDALADITEIYRYIAADNPGAAARVVARIQARLQSASLPSCRTAAVPAVGPGRAS